jgi:hypothetical protein
MPQVHTVIACTGQYDNWSRREVATFSDRSVADKLALDAQAVADMILARGVGVRDKGQNPHDLHMRIEDGEMSYYVSTSEILDSPAADPAANAAQLGVIEDYFAFTAKNGLWNAFEVEKSVGPRELTGEMEDLYGEDRTEPERSPVPLRKVQYRNLSFCLYLNGHLAAQRWTEKEEFDTPVVHLEGLTAEEYQEAITTGRTPRGLFGTSAPHLVWQCTELDTLFDESIAVVDSNQTVSAQQLIRLFESWLIQSQHRRKSRPEFAERLSALGL